MLSLVGERALKDHWWRLAPEDRWVRQSLMQSRCWV